ncbi:hypothetical protein Vc3S01_1420 [Vibrio campbellii]|nr:hypothetical protein Vc3S01_1420 [Vibrio campbellii]EDL70634.1 hypothetical protein A1Q_3881 [Vibrio campbellii HY01]
MEKSRSNHIKYADFNEPFLLISLLGVEVKYGAPKFLPVCKTAQ